MGQVFIVVAVVATVAMLCERALAPRAFLRHDPANSHDIGLREARGFSSVEVAIDGAGVDVPAALGNFAGTALLELDVRPRGLVPDLDPAILWRAGQENGRQHLASGSSGRRYLNLTALFDAPGEAPKRIELEGRGVGWSSGSSRLLLFDDVPLERSTPTLVIAPHPDDAEIAAFGFYATTDATVVTVTAGDAGGRNFRALWQDDREQFRVKGEVRTWDSVTVPRVGGVPAERARNLGFYDATVRQLWLERPEKVPPPYADLPRPDHYRGWNVDQEVQARSFESSWPGLVRELRAELERAAPEVIAAPHPQLDAHADHQFTTVALLEAVIESGWSGTLLLYTNHPVAAEPYPLGPATAVASAPPWFASSPELVHGGVFSLALDEETRRRKVLALEAMHDLRPFHPTPPEGARVRFLRAIDDVWMYLVGRRERSPRRYSYLRRGPRPNEFYFKLESGSAEALHDAFLDSFQAARAARAGE